jgi:hypothetical protein
MRAYCGHKEAKCVIGDYWECSVCGNTVEDNKTTITLVSSTATLYIKDANYSITTKSEAKLWRILTAPSGTRWLIDTKERMQGLVGDMEDESLVLIRVDVPSGCLGASGHTATVIKVVEIVE